MATVRARTFEYAVTLDPDWTAESDRGGITIPQDEAWTPEHLLLAGLSRCVLTSFAYHARRAGAEVSSSGSASGKVTKREEDGRFAFVEIAVVSDVTIEPEPASEILAELLEKAQRDCFVGASLAIKPTYRWVVNGEEVR
jgi:organic hydroperoxide reductase OsmC/OhrA